MAQNMQRKRLPVYNQPTNKRTNTDDYNKLQSEWYERLKKEGFNDIENSRTRLLNEWSVSFFRNYKDKNVYDVCEWYFDEARRILNEYQFNNDNDKAVWELHCEGRTIRQIAMKINIACFSRSTIHRKIKKLRKLIRTHG